MWRLLTDSSFDLTGVSFDLAGVSPQHHFLLFSFEYLLYESTQRKNILFDQ